MHNGWRKSGDQHIGTGACWHKAALTALIAAGCMTWLATASAEDGKALFESQCSSCHSIGAGVLAGPDLAGVSARRRHDWLVKFIQSEQALIKAGDRISIALAEHYKVGMPDQSLSEEQIGLILAHIAGAESETAAAKQVSMNAQSEEIRKGRDLFEGRVRLSAGGPSCYACHSAAGTSGGLFAGELTSIASRMGKEWVGGVLKEAPFAAMQSAYHGKPLAASEIAAVVSYLESTAAQPVARNPLSFELLAGGLGGLALLIALFSFTGRNRKKQSVYQDIYDRQTKAG